ncbi:hypothetical protein D3C74_385780 [compost metagenome]
MRAQPDGERARQVGRRTAVREHAVAPREVELGRERPRPDDRHRERSRVPVARDRERAEVLAQERLRAPLVHAGPVGELPAVRADLDGQVGEQGRGAPHAVGPRPPLGQAHEERDGRDPRGHLGEVPEDHLLRLEHVGALTARPRSVPAD